MVGLGSVELPGEVLFDAAVGSDDLVYVVSDGYISEQSGEMFVFDRDLDQIDSWTLAPRNVRAAGLGIDSSDNLYVADPFSDRVFVYGSDGTFLLSFGDPGGVNGRFTSPSDVAVDALGYIYVSDIENAESNFYKYWGTSHSGVQVFSPIQ